MAERVSYHYENGDEDLAKLLKAEGLALAEAYDFEENFLVIG